MVGLLGKIPLNMNTQQLVGDKAWEFLFVLGQPGMGSSRSSIRLPFAERVRSQRHAKACRTGAIASLASAAPGVARVELHHA
jgi:hypothetical protein